MGDAGRGQLSRRRPPRPGVCAAILVGLLGWTAATAAGAERARSLAFSAGIFDLGGTEVPEGGFELRFPVGEGKLEAVGGFHRNAEGGYYGFGGLRRDFRLGACWRVTPAFAVALYEPWRGVDLGGLVELRSAVELGYVLPRRSRLAVTFYHLSNQRIHRDNPGLNSLILTYSFDVGGR